MIADSTRRLLDHHRQHLHASGINDATINAAGIYTETDHTRLAMLLNRKTYSRKNGPAIVFPFIDASGSVVLNRVRPDYSNGGGKYLQPSGTETRVYFPSSVYQAAANVEQPLIITEGEKKALAATQCGHPTIGLTGVDCWHKRGSSALLPDLEHIGWNGRKVFIVFDSDWATNPNVAENVTLLSAALVARGARVLVVDLITPEPTS